jgi:hypothetical protein
MSAEKTTLRRLTEDGRRLLGEPFLRGEHEIAETVLAAHVEEVPGAPAVDLRPLDEAVAEVIAEYDRYDSGMDSVLVAEVRRHVDVDRRTAADPGLWHWLAAVRYPEYVRHRWQFKSETAMREKFLGAGTDLYSNAFHRYWWIAELTRDGRDYELPRAVFGDQTMVNKVFDRWFARYRPAAISLCRELLEEPPWVVEETTTKFNHALTNVQLEALDEPALRTMLERVIAEVHAERASADGDSP